MEAVAPKESEGVGVCVWLGVCVGVMEVVRLMLGVRLGVGVWEGAVDREKLGELNV